MSPVQVGVIGCGNILRQYVTHAKLYSSIQITACADIIESAAQNAAQTFGIPKVYATPQKLLKDKSIDVILNLTVPKAHLEVTSASLKAGKHVYSEKPLGVDVKEAQKLINLARKKNLRIGCAPDTFFGAGHQTSRKLIDDGAIGKPIAATAFMCCRGHEGWHPNPEFHYQPGGGPMLDMGPYYTTALIHMLGPIRRVCGFAGMLIPQRTITHSDGKGGKGPKWGQIIQISTPDHVAGTIEFVSGAIATIITSFATSHPTHQYPLTVWGTEGTLGVPDPNGFDGAVKLCKRGEKDWTEVPFTHQKGFARASGLVDMVHAIRDNRPHRASGDLAFMALEAMTGFLKSSETGKAINITPGYDRPAPLPVNLQPGNMD